MERSPQEFQRSAPLNHRGDVLVVDDIPDNLQLLSEILRRAGFRVRSVLNGRRALRAARVEKPDLVLMDVNMPEMNGYELCREFKKDDSLGDVPVIFISALTGATDKVDAFAAGGLDYVTKPFQAEEIIARVETHISLGRYRQELSVKNELLESAYADLKAAQLKFVQQEKMASLGLLTAGIAHEINNPVNFVSSGVEGLAKVHRDIFKILESFDALTAENVARQLKEIEALKRELGYEVLLEGMRELAVNIREGAKRTADIVKGLRTFSRLDEQERKMADLHENIDAALLMLSNQYKRTVTVRKGYGRLPSLLCFPGKLNQLFVNILKNAIDAVTDHRAGLAPGEGEIVIRTELISKGESDWVTVVFSDNGRGIAPDIKDRIFEPFFTTKQVGEGLGLGLAICYGIVEEHHGRIEVESEPGKGAHFRVWLPIEL